MKAYIATTGIIFFLLAVAHVARVFVEGTHVLTELIFMLTSIVSVAIFLWAVVLFRRTK